MTDTKMLRASFMLCGQKKTYKVCRVLVQSMVWYSMKLQTINGGQARQLHKATGFEIIMPNILVHNSLQIFHHLSQMNACLFSAGGGQFCTITQLCFALCFQSICRCHQEDVKQKQFCKGISLSYQKMSNRHQSACKNQIMISPC